MSESNLDRMSIILALTLPTINAKSKAYIRLLSTLTVLANYVIDVATIFAEKALYSGLIS